MKLYTIYEKPLDYPEYFVVREWIIKDGESMPGELLGLADTLDAARLFYIPDGLMCSPRKDGDDSKIVETWL